MSLRELDLRTSFNYIACFLTLDCNIGCDYCINSHGGSGRKEFRILSGEEWVEAINRITATKDLPVTLQGGEPSLHPDFIYIIRNIKSDLSIDILTNLSFDVDKFINEVDPSRLSRKAAYSNIRVSYHPAYMELDVLAKKVLKMQEAGFSVGIYGILHPTIKDEVLAAKEICLKKGIDFRTKEFLGVYNGQLYGTYRYEGAVGSIERKKCLCRVSEFIVGPDGDIFRCHHDLYKGLPSVGSMLDPGLEINNEFRECAAFGDCNPCDIKVKTNRFQEFGYTSAQITGISG